MNLEEKLRQLRKAAEKTSSDRELERQLEGLRRRTPAPVARLLPAQRVPCGIEHYVEGSLEQNARGEYFVARQALPFGRPYGRLRVGDVSAADLGALQLFLEAGTLPHPAELIYLDTETTGLAGGTGTCAFLIGVGAIEGSEFVVRQFFLRDYPDEKAVLAALAERLAGYRGLVTFNGKTFDVPLLETRFALARQKSPFGRLIHLDLLHPARRLWKLRLESCQLTRLEAEVLGLRRQGDVAGCDIPGIYFDYLRTGDARGLQPVFYHNALDIITLAALTTEVARIIRAESEAGGASGSSIRTHSLDLFSLSRIFERVGEREKAVSACRRALDAGLPSEVELRALWQLAAQWKRQGEHERAVEVWEQIARRQGLHFLEALEQLAIHAEHRRRDAGAAMAFTEKALEWLRGSASREAAGGARRAGNSQREWGKFNYRLDRLRKMAARAGKGAVLYSGL